MPACRDPEATTPPSRSRSRSRESLAAPAGGGKRPRPRACRRDLGLVDLPVDPIAQPFPPEMADTLLQPLADPLGDPDGGPVLRMDEADHALLLQDGKGIGQRLASAFGRVAPPPPAPHQ